MVRNDDLRDGCYDHSDLEVAAMLKLKRIKWKPNATFNDRMRCWHWLADNDHHVTVIEWHDGITYTVKP